MKNEARPQGFSRRGLLAGVVSGAAAGAGLSRLPDWIFEDPARIPWIAEPYSNCFWFDSAGLYTRPVTSPLLDRRTTADVTIIGAGFTGLSAAYHLSGRFPDSRIIVLEAGRYGHGASGRSGGHVLATNLQARNLNLSTWRHINDLMGKGVDQIRSLVVEHSIDCDFYERGYTVLGVHESDGEYFA